MSTTLLPSSDQQFQEISRVLLHAEEYMAGNVATQACGSLGGLAEARPI